MTNYDVYGIGNALVDMEFRVDPEFLKENNIDKGLMTLIEQDRKREILDKFNGNIVRASGGSAANTTFAVSQFGAKTFYACKVAKDEAGEFYLNDLKNNGVDANSYESAGEGVTGKCLVMVTPDADRTMNTFLGITQTFSKDQVDLERLKKSQMLYIEGYLVASPTGKDAAVWARSEADKNDVKTALTFSDPNMVEFFKDGMKEIIGNGVHLIFSNEDEAKKYAGNENLEDAIKEISKVADIVAVTRGAEGALIYVDNEFISVPTKSVKPIDTNGAGDMFAGAFLYAYSLKKDLRTCAEFGCLCASKIVTKFGPRLDIDEAKAALSEMDL